MRRIVFDRRLNAAGTLSLAAFLLAGGAFAQSTDEGAAVGNNAPAVSVLPNNGNCPVSGAAAVPLLTPDPSVGARTTIGAATRTLNETSGAALGPGAACPLARDVVTTAKKPDEPQGPAIPGVAVPAPPTIAPAPTGP